MSIFKIQDPVLRANSRAAIIATTLLAGCAADPYHYGTGRMQIDTPNSPVMQNQFLQGKPNAFLDAADWYWPESLLRKLILWDKNVDAHQISPATIAAMQQFIERNELENVQVLVNCYAPGNQWSRLVHNRTVGAGWRYTIGTLSTIFYTILPGRFFGGDAYNPYTNTIYLYSDDAMIALHEAGHAKDFGRREWKGTNAALYAVPFVSLYYEARATSDALGYVHDQQDSSDEKHGYEVLYPAYGTYIGGGLTPFGGAEMALIGIIPGHIAGRIASSQVVENKTPTNDAEPTNAAVENQNPANTPENISLEPDKN